MPWRILVIPVLALTLLGAMACGDDDDDDAGDDGSPTATAPADGSAIDEPGETDGPSETDADEPSETDADEPSETDDDGGGTTVDLDAADFSFSRSTITAPAGSEVTVEFANVGNAPHTFTVDDLGVSEQLSSGGNATIAFTMPDSETEFYCAIHPTLMMGTLVPGEVSARSQDNGGGTSDGDDPYIE